MKKTMLATLIALAASLGLASMAHAADDAQRTTAKERRAERTPEEKAAAKAKWDAKTPDEKAAAKAKFAEKHPKAAAKMTEKKDAAATK